MAASGKTIKTSQDWQATLAPMLLSPVREGNRVQTLVNGDAIFPAMLEAIQHAERSITFENFVWWSGSVTERFAHAFCEKARAGVPVHVVIDWAGGIKADGQRLRRMRECGVRLVRFHPPNRWPLKFQRRAHRKLLIVDGKIGFTGGVGIADEWSGDGHAPGNRRDNHYRVQGPVVADMQAAFFDRWDPQQPPPDDLAAYFPRLEEAGHLPCQFVTNSPHEGAGRARFAYRVAIDRAERSIFIGNAYFVPDGGMVKTICDAARRGVEVRLLVPGPQMDHKVAGAAMHALFPPLLEAGVKVYEFQPSMYHCKVMSVDGALAVVGSANLDERSLRLNDEANLHVYDEAFAADQESLLVEDLQDAKPVTLEQWRERQGWRNVGDRAAAMLRGQL